MTSNPGIKVKGLVKHFGNIVALNGIDLEIEKGHIVGILGQNGAGKSTLVRLLSGVMKPTSGTAWIDGHELELEVNEVKRVTGLLPEEYALYEKLSIFEYIEFLGTLYGMGPSKITDRFERIARRLKVYELRNRLIDTLSKGQKQKVAVIAAIIHEPTVLYLDEPLANLDVAAQREVRKMIQEYKAENRTILIATHLLSNVEATCDQIIIIDRGIIRFNGPLEEFKKSTNDIEEAYLTYLER